MEEPGCLVIMSDEMPGVGGKGLVAAVREERRACSSGGQRRGDIDGGGVVAGC